ncbi:complement factor B-like [Lineus longissimus]|uniref:complement factor B-like n=1 Tax=Lineus longissimus TaxID=88925 RepID=UPI002B4CDA01
MIGYCLLLVVGFLTSHTRAECDDYDYTADGCTLDATCYMSLIVNGKGVGNDGSPKDTYNIGERMRVVCDEGYMIDRGDSEATCQDDLTWSWRVEPRCVPKPPPPPLCTASKDMVEGMYVNRTEKAAGGVYWKLYVNCYVDEDYYLHGPGVYICEGTTWKGNSFCLKRRVCPKITAPINGFITIGDMNSRNEGDEVHFGCKRGYTLMGDRRWRCKSTLSWSGYNVFCEKDLGIAGMAKGIQENIIDKFKQHTVSAANRGRISASNVNGIDLFFLVDRSDSISAGDFKMARDFINTLVDFFGISSKGGATRLAVISFGTDARLELSFDVIQKMEECLIKAKQDGENIQDYDAAWAKKCINVTADPLGDYNPKCTGLIPVNIPAGINETEIGMSLKELVKRKINLIQSSGGGTNMADALGIVRKIKMRCNAEKAVFLMSDGRDNMVTNLALDAMLHGIRRSVDEIFGIGIGQDLHMDQLEAIASEPIARHVFRLRDFKELAKLQQLIITTQNDYSACGVSTVQRTRSVVVNRSKVQEAKPRSWPWLVKISKNQGQFLCGGALVAKNYVLTTASCLYSESGVLLGPVGKSDSPITVTVGYFDANDMGGWQTSVAAELKVYTNFSIAHPRVNDVALIRLRDDVQLNSYVRILCLPGPADSILFHKVRTRWLVGWNSSNAKPLMTMTAKPWERTMKLHGKRDCSRAHSYTASQSYLQCMGDRYQKRGYCAGDKGSPIVVPAQDIDGKPIYKVVALVEDGSECMRPGKLTVVTQLTSRFISWIKGNIN